MPKTFTNLAAILLLLIAACHLVRAVMGIAITIDAIAIPMWTSWLAAGVTGILGIMVFAEMRNQ